MQVIRRLVLYPGSQEERLPEYAPDFPYIASRAELDRFPGGAAPWHWHQAMELFYMQSGTIRYFTPGGEVDFPAGTGGMVNSNVLHSTRVLPQEENTVALIHLFDPELIAGQADGRIGRRYVAPLTETGGREVIALSPACPGQAAVLEKLRQSFQLPEGEFGYELKLRNALSDIWLDLLQLATLQPVQGGNRRDAEKAKQLLAYIHRHYPEKLTVARLAAAAYLSERECYRIFQSCLHTTPLACLTSYRLQQACRLLAETQASVTEIAQACGLGSSSYFGRLLRQTTGCTPLAYRQKWQDREKNTRNIDSLK